MKLSPGKINSFLMFKLPAAYFTGVRVNSISETSCETRVRHKWINQNPFKSLFWAVQGMAAELSTGALVMAKARERKESFSILVIAAKATFSKKAKGRIQFACKEGQKVNEAIEKAINTGEGQTLWMESVGTDSSGEVVSVFQFEWAVKMR